MLAGSSRSKLWAVIAVLASLAALSLRHTPHETESNAVTPDARETRRTPIGDWSRRVSIPALPELASAPPSSDTSPNLRVGVEGEDGAPVGGARVTVRTAADLLFEQTNDEGYAAIALPQPGHAHVRAAADGYADGTTETEVAPTGSEVKIVLRRSSALTGTVAGYRGQPEDLAVVAALAAEPGRVQSAGVSLDGQFRFDALPPGSYLLGLHPAAFRGDPLEVQLDPGEHEAITLTLPRIGSIDLTALLPPNSGPPHSASLRLVRSAEGMEIARPLVVTSGETQRIEGIPAGQFGVELTVDGLAEMPFQRVDIMPDRASALRFVWPTGRIAGRVVTRSGPAIAAAVGAFRVVPGAGGRDVRDNNPDGTAQAGVDGSYALNGLGAGRYLVAVQRGALIAAREVALGDGEQRTLDLELASGRTLLARVLHHGEPVQGARVLAASQPYAENARSIETDTNGLAEIRHLTGGPYLVRAVWLENDERPPLEARAEVNLDDGTGDVVLELH